MSLACTLEVLPCCNFNNLRQNFASQLVQKHHNVVFNAVRQQF